MQEQRDLISVLAGEKNENERRYERILKAINDASDDGGPPKTSAGAGVDRGLQPRRSNASIDTATTLVNPATTGVNSITTTSGSQVSKQRQPSESSGSISTGRGPDSSASTTSFGTLSTVGHPSDIGLSSIPPASSSPSKNEPAPLDLPAGLKHHHDRIRYHSDLVQNLLAEISSLHYKIDHGIRDRMQNGVLALHYNEWLAIRSIYGDDAFEKILADHEDVVSSDLNLYVQSN